MQLYLIEAHINTGVESFWARSWKSSKADASAERSRFIEIYGVKRGQVAVKEVDVDTRKQGLLNLLNKVSTQCDGELYL